MRRAAYVGTEPRLQGQSAVRTQAVGDADTVRDGRPQPVHIAPGHGAHGVVGHEVAGCLLPAHVAKPVISHTIVQPHLALAAVGPHINIVTAHGICDGVREVRPCGISRHGDAHHEIDHPAHIAPVAHARRVGILYAQQVCGSHPEQVLGRGRDAVQPHLHAATVVERRQCVHHLVHAQPLQAHLGQHSVDRCRRFFLPVRGIYHLPVGLADHPRTLHHDFFQAERVDRLGAYARGQPQSQGHSQPRPHAVRLLICAGLAHGCQWSISAKSRPRLSRYSSG